MAEDEASITPIDNDEPEETPGYKAPEQKTLEEIQNLDQEDESLVRYKQTLLAGVDAGAAPADDPRKVVVMKLIFAVEGRPDVELDLTGDITKLRDKPIVIKEGIEYKMKVVFKIQHEIVSGLKYHQVVSRKGLKVDKASHMVGSYGPKVEPHVFITPSDEAPKGMLARGHYKCNSKFIDDDKNVHLSWEWAFDIKKDW